MGDVDARPRSGDPSIPAAGPRGKLRERVKRPLLHDEGRVIVVADAITYVAHRTRLGHLRCRAAIAPNAVGEQRPSETCYEITDISGRRGIRHVIRRSGPR